MQVDLSMQIDVHQYCTNTSETIFPHLTAKLKGKLHESDSPCLNVDFDKIS